MQVEWRSNIHGQLHRNISEWATGFARTTDCDVTRLWDGSGLHHRPSRIDADRVGHVRLYFHRSLRLKRVSNGHPSHRQLNGLLRDLVSKHRHITRRLRTRPRIQRNSPCRHPSTSGCALPITTQSQVSVRSDTEPEKTARSPSLR
jgi:hypothetical protein